jgi:hypothetical protein
MRTLYVTSSAKSRTWSEPNPLDRLNTPTFNPNATPPSLRTRHLPFYSGDRTGGSGGLDLYVSGGATVMVTAPGRRPGHERRWRSRPVQQETISNLVDDLRILFVDRRQPLTAPFRQLAAILLLP